MKKRNCFFIFCAFFVFNFQIAFAQCNERSRPIDCYQDAIERLQMAVSQIKNLEKQMTDLAKVQQEIASLKEELKAQEAKTDAKLQKEIASLKEEFTKVQNTIPKIKGVVINSDDINRSRNKESTSVYFWVITGSTQPATITLTDASFGPWPSYIYAHRRDRADGKEGILVGLFYPSRVEAPSGTALILNICQAGMTQEPYVISDYKF